MTQLGHVDFQFWDCTHTQTWWLGLWPRFTHRGLGIWTETQIIKTWLRPGLQNWGLKTDLDLRTDNWTTPLLYSISLSFCFACSIFTTLLVWFHHPDFTHTQTPGSTDTHIGTVNTLELISWMISSDSQILPSVMTFSISLCTHAHLQVRTRIIKLGYWKADRIKWWIAVPDRRLLEGCSCVCVCEREKERGEQTDRQTEARRSLSWQLLIVNPLYISHSLWHHQTISSALLFSVLSLVSVSDRNHFSFPGKMGNVTVPSLQFVYLCVYACVA